MKSFTISLCSHIRFSPWQVTNWCSKPEAFDRLIPPWEKLEVLSQEGEVFYVRISGTLVQWTRTVHAVDATSCDVEDRLVFSSKTIFLRPSFKKRLRRILRWQHATLQNDLQFQKNYSQKPLRILVSGSSGLVGSGLVIFLRMCGHQVRRLVRSEQEGSDVIVWDPSGVNIGLAEQLEGFDCMVHLAGKNIAAKRWTPNQMLEIASSRVRDTRLLCQLLATLKDPPSTFICASAIGIYGDQGETELTEHSPPGQGFLAEVCQQWEAASLGLEARGVRRVYARFGVILSPRGGMLARMLAPFRLGMGAILGSGQQYISWIGLEDVVYAVSHLMMQKEVRGGVNLTTNYPETNASFSQKLASSLHRPLMFRLQETIIRLILGREMADSLILASARAQPEKLLRSDYRFVYPKLEQLFRRLFS